MIAGAGPSWLFGVRQVEDEDSGRAMAQSRGAHRAARDDADRPIVGVDDDDEDAFFRGRRR